MENYIHQNKERFLDELFGLLRIPSVSTNPESKQDVRKAADYLAERIREAGADEVEVCLTAGHPIVYGEKIIDPSLPTVLVYGHYDVQPPDPLELWESPPFEPVIKDGHIYARGSSDDKGQMYIHVKAFEAMYRTGNLPCNIKFMIEGEEEVGSKNLDVFVRENREKLACDIILISDTGMIAPGIPCVTVGLRGMSYMEVEVIGAERDLHSGLYGGAAPNPINVLCEMIAKLKDKNERVTVPGFYDKVLEVSKEEREQMALAPFDEKEFCEEIGINMTVGEKEYSTSERISIRPTLDVNGIWGGYTAPGAKTVIASKANAKISMRLVPDQDHEKITKDFINYMISIAPPSVKVKITPHHGAIPVVTPIESAGFRAASRACEEVFGRAALPKRGGGSIPIVAMLKQELGTDSVLLGFGLDSDAIHSPNEKFVLDHFYKGIETVPKFFKYFTELTKKG